MCFTTWGPVRHSKNAPGLSVTQRWPWIALRAFGALPLPDTSCNSPEATAESLGYRSVEINPHRSAHHSHPP